MQRSPNSPIITSRDYRGPSPIPMSGEIPANNRDMKRNPTMIRQRYLDDINPSVGHSPVIAKNYFSLSYPPSSYPPCCEMEQPYPFYEEECSTPPPESNQPECLQCTTRPQEFSHPDPGNIHRLHINERVVQMCQQRQHRSITPAEYHKTSPLFGKFLPRPSMRVPNLSYCGMDPYQEYMFDAAHAAPEIPLLSRGPGNMSAPIPFVVPSSSSHEIGIMPMDSYYAHEQDGRKIWSNMRGGGFDGYSRELQRPPPYRMTQETMWQNRSLRARAEAGTATMYDVVEKEKAIDRNSIFVYPTNGAGNRPFLMNKGYYIKFLFNKCVVVDLMTSANKLAAFFKNVDIGFAIGDPYKNLGDRWCLMTCSDKFQLMVGTMVMIHYCRRKFLKKRGTVDKKIKNEQREKDRKLQHSYTRTTFKFLCDGVVDEFGSDVLRDELVELTKKVNDCAKSQTHPTKDDNGRSIFGEYNVVSASIDDFEGMHHAVSTYLYSLEKQPGNIDTLIAQEGEIEDPCLRCFIGEKDPTEPEYIVGVVSAVKTKPDTAMSVMYKILEQIINANYEYGSRVDDPIKVFLRFNASQELYHTTDGKDLLRSGTVEFPSTIPLVEVPNEHFGSSESRNSIESPTQILERIETSHSNSHPVVYSGGEELTPAPNTSTVCRQPWHAMVDIAS